VIHAARLRTKGSGTLFERERSGTAPRTTGEYEALLAGLLTRERGRKDVHGMGPRNELVHLERLPAREAVHADLGEPLPEALRRLLEAQEIHRLYRHQAMAIDHARAGEHVAVATGTASGKSLAYHLPILERLLLDREAIALYLFPTKALAQDQLRGLERFREISAALRPLLRAGTYDGDTPPFKR
jgi:DEAD/DEAH box helicase domain-containing protein